MFALNVMKALAIILVTQSHMRDFYPYRQLATGGMLGNTLFFFSSSVAITLGLQRKPESFTRWYARRLERVYFQLWIVTVLLISTGVFVQANFQELLARFLFPIDYWFLPAIALLYPIAFLLIGSNSKRVNFMALIVTGAVYACLYCLMVDFRSWNSEDHILVKTTFYLGVMIVGVILAQTKGRDPSRSSGLLTLAMLTVSFFGYLAFLRATEAYFFQFGAQILATLWTISLFRTLRYPPIENWLHFHLDKPVRFISALTLQIYLVQVPLVDKSTLYKLMFPLNVIVFVFFVIVLAWLLSAVSTVGFSRFRKLDVTAAKEKADEG